MSDHEPLAGIDSKINDRGFFERILGERDKLETERDRRFEDRFKSIDEALKTALASRDRELVNALAAAKEAVIKQEQANDKKFESANEWRGQSADRERSQQEQIATFVATLLPRETFEAFLRTHNETVRRLESFQSRALGALALAVVIVPGLTALILWTLTTP